MFKLSVNVFKQLAVLFGRSLCWWFLSW